jgi:histidinol-phosphate aminotransferase
MSLKPCASILDIAPYVGGKSVEGAIKLSSNENALGVSLLAVEACRKYAGDIFRYPDGGAVKLREALAKLHNLNYEQIVCGAGSDELISLLCRAYASHGNEILISQYAFLMYSINAKAVGATPVYAKESDYHADIDAMLAAVTDKTKIVFLANPNNPTGTYIEADEVKRLHKGLPDDVLLVIDAAYAEFVGGDDCFDMVEEHENVVVLRTFSKIYGLSGLRIGWAYCPAAVADVLNRIRPPFNVNMMAQKAALAALSDEEFIAKSKAHNDKWMAILNEELPKIGIKLTDSKANFVLAEFTDAKATYEYLEDNGIITRPVAAYGLLNHLRITIGKDEEMERLLEALDRQ